MRLSFIPLAALALPLAACATSPYGYGYGSSSYGAIAPIGALGSGYGSFTQAAASSCANYAARYGRAGVRSVRQLDRNHVKVFGTVARGYRNEGWDCTFRSDGRITDFDL